MCLLLVGNAPLLMLVESSFGHGWAFYYNGARFPKSLALKIL